MKNLSPEIIDVKSKCLVNAAGARPVKFPRTLIVSEKIGSAVSQAFVGSAALINGVPYSSAEPFEARPRNKRRIGAGTLTVALAVGLAAAIPEIATAVSNIEIPNLENFNIMPSDYDLSSLHS